MHTYADEHRAAYAAIEKSEMALKQLMHNISTILVKGGQVSAELTAAQAEMRRAIALAEADIITKRMSAQSAGLAELGDDVGLGQRAISELYVALQQPGLSRGDRDALLSQSESIFAAYKMALRSKLAHDRGLLGEEGRA